MGCWLGGWARGQGSRREQETDQSSGLSCSTRFRLVGVTRRLRPLNKPCKPCINRASRANLGNYRWNSSAPGDSTAPACSGSIAPSARLPAGSRAAACLLQPVAPARAFRIGPCTLPQRESRLEKPPIQHLSWVEGAISSAKPLSIFPRFSGCQVRVLCITAMFPLSTTMQSLIDA